MRRLNGNIFLLTNTWIRRYFPLNRESIAFGKLFPFMRRTLGEKDIASVKAGV